MTSTLEGWQPEVGTKVHYRMFSPNHRYSGTLAAQVADAGGLDAIAPDPTDPVFTVLALVPHHLQHGVTRYCLAEQGHRQATNWPDDDYTVLWPAEDGGLW